MLSMNTVSREHSVKGHSVKEDNVKEHGAKGHSVKEDNGQGTRC